MALNPEPCPGCGVLLPRVDGPTHRYIGASPACWAIYSALLAGGMPDLEILTPPPVPAIHTALASRLPEFAAGEFLVDAYAAQHPGEPSPQAIQSVAVHLLALYGVLERGVSPGKALWIRLRAVRERGVFRWLEPPSFRDTLTIVHVAEPDRLSEGLEWRSMWPRFTRPGRRRIERRSPNGICAVCRARLISGGCFFC